MCMGKKWNLPVLVLIFLALVVNANAENLIPNGDMEASRSWEGVSSEFPRLSKVIERTTSEI